MSPEQKAGVRTPPDQTRKIDIFALGVIFFELCCPFSTDMERFKVQLLTTKGPTNNWTCFSTCSYWLMFWYCYRFSRTWETKRLLRNLLIISPLRYEWCSSHLVQFDMILIMFLPEGWTDSYSAGDRTFQETNSWTCTQLWPNEETKKKDKEVTGLHTCVMI